MHAQASCACSTRPLLMTIKAARVGRPHPCGFDAMGLCVVMSLQQPDASGMAAQAERALWFVAGCVALVAAIVGVVMPVMPTLPFAVLAFLCFSHSSERSRQWLLRQPLLGPMLRDWQAHHGLTLRAKWWSGGVLAVSALTSWWWLPSPWRWVPVVYAWLVIAWLWYVPTWPLHRQQQHDPRQRPPRNRHR
jgi:uncharacterized protein